MDHVGDPDEASPVCLHLEVAIEHVVGDVELPISKPPVERRTGGVKDGIGEPGPRNALGLISPELFPRVGIGCSLPSNVVRVVSRILVHSPKNILNLNLFAPIIPVYNIRGQNKRHADDRGGGSGSTRC
jgi:hypothetical protein